MGMHFDAEFWNRFVIPASVAEPALRHAMVAVGIFAEQLEDAKNDIPARIHGSGLQLGPRSISVARRKSDDSDLVALTNYNKSIGMLTKLVSSADKTTDVVLLACILFVCVELLRCDDDAAFRHFKGGMTIIMDAVARKQSFAGPQSMADRIESSILPAFHRLELLSALFGNSASWPYPVALSDTIPAKFTSIVDARDSMVHLMNLSLRFVQSIQMLEYEPYAIPMSAYDEQAELLKYLQLWRTRFSTFQTSRARQLIADDHYAANVLEIQRIVANSWVSTVMDPYQCAHDAHIPAYTAAVVLAEQIYGTGNMQIRHARRASTFLLDVEIVGPLHWVCIKCRDPAVRRRAIAVMRSMNRREGMWNSKIAAAIAERVMVVEEAGLDWPGLPSEAARIHGLPFAFDADVGPLGVLVTFQSKPFGVYEDWSVWQEQVTLEET